MTSGLTSNVERGMQLASTLPDIMPDQADARIKPIYEDIQATLRVPIVNLIFRTLANYPDYLERAWSQLRQIAGLRRFEEAADQLRKHALLTPLPEPLNGDPGQELRAFNDTIHYVLPKLLLSVTVLDQVSFGDGLEPGAAADAPVPASIPRGIAKGTGKVKMVSPDPADEHLRALFESIKQRHGHPLVSSYFRGLGNWPEFLQAAWDNITPYVGSSDYEGGREDLVRQSLAQVRAWPMAPIEVPSEQKQDVRDILSAFRLKFIPEMLLDVVLIKCALDGEAAARVSRFSALR